MFTKRQNTVTVFYKQLSICGRVMDSMYTNTSSFKHIEHMWVWSGHGGAPTEPARQASTWRMTYYQSSTKRKSNRENLRLLRATWRPSPESC